MTLFRVLSMVALFVVVFLISFLLAKWEYERDAGGAARLLRGSVANKVTEAVMPIPLKGTLAYE